MGSQQLLPQAREWGDAVTSLLLFAVSLRAFHRAREVNLGSAMGFLLQACAGALGTAHCCIQSTGALSHAHWEARWASAVIGLPLVSFGFHWMHRDRLAANSVLFGGVLAAACSDSLSGGGQEPAVGAAVAAALLSLFAVSLFTGSAWGAAGSLLIAAAQLCPAGLPCPRGPRLQSLLLSTGMVALNQALSTPHGTELA